MILSYLPLVRLVAEQVRRRLPVGVDIEPLVHSGIVGLLEALDRFDPERGVSFQAYARYRIHGEIMQCLRSLDSVSRSARFWARRIAAARKNVATAVCREATSEEVAEELGLSMHAYYRVYSKLNECRPVRLDDAETLGVDEQVHGSIVRDCLPCEDPLRLVEHRDLMEKMQAAVLRLSQRERQVVELYHRDGLTFKQIARRFGLTEGRISQIYHKARVELRRALD